MERVLTPLCEIAKKFGTDKGGWHLIAGDTCHNYTPQYYELLKDRRESVERVLEIGVNYGCSLRMWEEFFPNAEIVGLDCNQLCLFNIGRITSYLADQGSQESLLKAMATISEAQPGPLFDLIVDDGSHETEHQVLSAATLMPFVKPGGYYIIEDLNIDCHPEIVAKMIQQRYPILMSWMAIDCGIGLGKARCHPQCPYCQGTTGEQLLVLCHG